MNNFSTNLVYLRKKKGFNQKQMAEYLKIKPSTYANYETGFSKPELDTFFSISKLLGVTMDNLVNRDLSDTKNYEQQGKLKDVAEPGLIAYLKKQTPLNKQEELLFKIIRLNEKLLIRTEELRIKDIAIAELTEKIKQLEEELNSRD